MYKSRVYTGINVDCNLTTHLKPSLVMKIHAVYPKIFEDLIFRDFTK